MKNTITVDRYSEQLTAVANLISKGLDCWTEAGTILCQMIDADPLVIDRIASDLPNISKPMLYNLEKIGRKQIAPEILMKSGAAWKRLLRAPYSVQQKFLAPNSGVDLLVRKDDGEYDSLRVAVDVLTPHQARQAIDSEGTVRDLGAQRAYLAENTERFAPPEEVEKTFTVNQKTQQLVVLKPRPFDFSELLQIIAANPRK